MLIGRRGERRAGIGSRRERRETEGGWSGGGRGLAGVGSAELLLAGGCAPARLLSTPLARFTSILPLIGQPQTLPPNDGSGAAPGPRFPPPAPSPFTSPVELRGGSPRPPSDQSARGLRGGEREGTAESGVPIGCAPRGARFESVAPAVR